MATLQVKWKDRVLIILPRWKSVRIGTLASLLVVVAASALVMLSAAPANAYCQGNGTGAELPIFYPTSGTPKLRERAYPYSGTTTTCDGDFIYRGQIQDSIDFDGLCAYAGWLENTPPSGGMAILAAQCTTGPWKEFYGYEQGNQSSSVNQYLCGTWQCTAPHIAGAHNWGF